MKLMLRFLLFLFALSLTSATTFAQTIRYVKEGGAGTKNGSSWDNASDDLQGAIQASAANDFVAVAKGRYLPTRKANALSALTPNNRVNAFVLKANVKLYGGFAGDEIFANAADLLAQLTARNLRANTSTLSGDFNGDDIVTGAGTESLAFANNTENAYHVLISAGAVGTAEINGFRISGGYANGTGFIYDVNFRNISQVKGAGVVLEASSPRISNIEIVNNMVYATDNSEVYGGGIYINGLTQTIINFIIRDNIAKSINGNALGGGCHNSRNSLKLSFKNGLFENNISNSENANAHGGATCSDGDMVVTNVVFNKNRTISMSLDNRYGGAICNVNANLQLDNITAYGNLANNGSFLYKDSYGGIIVSTTINNSVIWNNTIFRSGFSQFIIKNSLVQRGVENLNEDPQFKDAANGDFTLKRTSRAIDAGNKDLYANAQTETDLTGAKRLRGGNIDIGAYEYQFDNTALHFDGANDVAVVPASNTFDLPQLTLEAWVKPESFSGNQTIIANRGSSGLRFTILQNATGIGLWNGVTGATVNWPKLPVLNRWYHLAVVLTTTTADVYINGNLMGSMAIGMGTDTNQPLLIGGGSTDISHEQFKGSIDELRIWKVKRSAAEIADYYSRPISNPSTQTNLLAYFEFGEGIANADNIGINSLTNSANATLNASLVNMARNGTVSNWVESYAMVAPINVTAGAAVSDRFALKWDSPYVGAVEQYIIDVATDSQFTQLITNSPFTVAGSASSKTITNLSPNTTYYTRIRAEKSNVATQGAYSAVQTVTTTIAFSPPGNALNFNGTDDYVNLGNSASLKPTSQLSIGIWVNRADWNTAVFHTIISNTQGGGYSINISNAATDDAGKFITALVYRNGAYARPSFDASQLTPGWHYIVLTYDGQVTTLYIDGKSEATDDALSVRSIGYHASNGTLIGAEPDAMEAPSSSAPRYFSGTLDELRIYNIALSAAEIKADMLSAASVKSTNLIAHYNFDAPSSSGVNVLYDVSDNNQDGTLSNFALTGNTSNWVESYAMVVPTAKAGSNITQTKFVANWDAPSLGIVDSYVLDVATDAGFASPVSGSPFTIAAGTNKDVTGLTAATDYYYRVRADKASVTGEGASSQTITVKTEKANQTISFANLDPKTTNSTDFTLGATASSGLAVSYTSSNTAVAEVYQDAGVWKVKIKAAGNTDITAIQVGDVSYNAASSVVQNLVVIDAVLPVTLISFTAKAEGNHAKLQWQTSSERNNKAFIVYRSGDDKQFVQIGEVAATFNSPLSTYNFIDKQPLNGNNYYKLVQLDNDGTSKELGTRPVAFNLQPSTFNVYPNPTLHKVSVTFERGKYHQLVLSDHLGKVLQQQRIDTQTEQVMIDLTIYPTGVYFIKLKAEGGNIVKKVVKQ